MCKGCTDQKRLIYYLKPVCTTHKLLMLVVVVLYLIWTRLPRLSTSNFVSQLCGRVRKGSLPYGIMPLWCHRYQILR